MATRRDARAGEHVPQLAYLFAMLGDETRLRIILACIESPISVGEIAEQLGLSYSLVSHHLRLLRAARLLRSERKGKHVFYSPLDNHVKCVIDDMLVHVAEVVDTDAP